MKQAVKRTVAGLVPASKSPGFRILMYHAVDEADSADRLSLRVTPESFRAQMNDLRAAGRQVVPLRSLLDGTDGGAADRVAITFDDGYHSQLRAAEILEGFGFPATFFVVIRFLNGDHGGADYWERWGYLGWEDLRALSDRGFEIGAHSVSHPSDLTRCPTAEMEQEIRGAKAGLEDRLGRSITSFSYPHGAYNDVVQRVVRDAGYRLACTSVSGTNYRPWPWFALRRTVIAGSDRLVDFQRKLQGKYDWIGPLHRWRAAHASRP